MKKRQVKGFLVLPVVVVVVLLAFQVLVTPAAYTDDITIASATITTSSATGYDYEIDLTYSYRFNDDYTLLKLHFSIIEDGYITTVTSKIINVNDYVNDTSGTNGLVTGTLALHFTEASIPHTEKNDKLLVRAFAYNASISTANLLDSDQDAVVFPYLTGADTTETEGEGYSLASYLILIFAGVGIIVLAIFLLMQWTPTRNAIVGLGVAIPFIGARLDARDTLIYEDGRKAWAIRGRDGQFKDIQDPGRAMAMDRKRTSKEERQARRKRK